MFFSLMRKKKELELEVANLSQQLGHQAREQAMVIKEKVSALELKSTEAAALLKLDFQQKVKQLELDSKRALDDARIAGQRALDDARAFAQKERSDFEKKLSDDYYARMKDSLTQLHTEGNITTQFLEKMALSMLGNTPEHKVRVSTMAIADK